MEAGFNKEGNDMPESFWKDMLGLGNSIAKVWQFGMCPDFNLDITNTPAHEA